MFPYHEARESIKGVGKMDHLQADIAVALRRRGRGMVGRRRRGPRMSVGTGNGEFSVLRVWKGGFAVAVEDAPRLTGYVDLFADGKRAARCLIVCADEEDGVVSYEYKHRTEDTASAPLDYVVR